MSSNPRGALVIRGLRKRFGDAVVLDGIDLDVAHGDIVAVLGPSGCGKTTLLRLIAGFEAPDAGTIEIDGLTVAGATHAVPPERRRVGVVPQEGALFPHLSVAQNVSFGLPGRAVAQRNRVHECLALVGLADRADARPHQLSGGQQQRVALARALAPRPSLAVLDEPFSALDASLRAQVRDDVAAAIRADGATAMLVTHDQQEALSVADRVGVLLHGHLAQVDEPARLYQHPVTLDVATFVGEAVVLPALSDGVHVHSTIGDLVADNHPDAGPVRVLLRPEQLELHDGPGAVAATVVARTYYGHDGLVRLVLADGHEVSARVHAADLPAIGQTVPVRVVGEVSAFPVS